MDGLYPGEAYVVNNEISGEAPLKGETWVPEDVMDEVLGLPDWFDPALVFTDPNKHGLSLGQYSGLPSPGQGGVLPVDGLTVEFWVEFSDSGQDEIALVQVEDTDGYGYELTTEGSDGSRQLRAAVQVSDGASPEELAVYSGAGTNVSATDVPYHVVMTFDGDSGWLRLFVDGVEATPDRFSGAGSPRIRYADPTGFEVIDWLDNTGENILIDELVVYDYALDPADVVQHYRVGSWSTSLMRLLGWVAGSGYPGDPVNAATGNFVHEHSDLGFVGSLGLLGWGRVYNSQDPTIGPLGPGWFTSFDMEADAVDLSDLDDTDVLLRDQGGRLLLFTATGTSGVWTSPPQVRGDLTFDDGGTSSDPTDDEYLLTFDWDEKWVFDAETGELVERWDGQGQVARVARSSGALDYVDLTDESDSEAFRRLDFTWGTDQLTVAAQLCTTCSGSRVWAAESPARQVVYDFDATDGTLENVTLPGGQQESYTWTDGVVTKIERLVDTVPDPDVYELVIQNWYDTQGRVEKQLTPSGQYIFYDYTQSRAETAATSGRWTPVVDDIAVETDVVSMTATDGEWWPTLGSTNLRSDLVGLTATGGSWFPTVDSTALESHEVDMAATGGTWFPTVDSIPLESHQWDVTTTGGTVEFTVDSATIEAHSLDVAATGGSYQLKVDSGSWHTFQWNDGESTIQTALAADVTGTVVDGEAAGGGEDGWFTIVWGDDAAHTVTLDTTNLTGTAAQAAQIAWDAAPARFDNVFDYAVTESVTVGTAGVHYRVMWGDNDDHTLSLVVSSGGAASESQDLAWDATAAEVEEVFADEVYASEVLGTPGERWRVIWGDNMDHTVSLDTTSLTGGSATASEDLAWDAAPGEVAEVFASAVAGTGVYGTSGSQYRVVWGDNAAHTTTLYTGDLTGGTATVSNDLDHDVDPAHVGYVLGHQVPSVAVSGTAGSRYLVAYGGAADPALTLDVTNLTGGSATVTADLAYDVAVADLQTVLASLVAGSTVSGTAGSDYSVDWGDDVAHALGVGNDTLSPAGSMSVWNRQTRVTHDDDGNLGTTGDQQILDYWADENGAVTRIDDPFANTVTQNWTDERLEDFTDRRGAGYATRYDDEGRIAMRVHPDPATGALPTITDPPNKSTQTGTFEFWDYVASGDSRVSVHTFDADTLASPLVTTYTYQGDELIPESVTDPAGDITCGLSTDGLVTKRIEGATSTSCTAGEVVTTYYYGDDDTEITACPARLLCSVVVDEAGADETKTVYTYTDAGRPETVTSAYDTAAAATTAYEYDAAGRTTRIFDAIAWADWEPDSDFDGSHYATDMGYDDAGRLAWTSDPVNPYTGGSGNPSVLYEYDTAGRVETTVTWIDVSKTCPTTGSPAKWQSSRGKCTVTVNAYDADGNLVSVTTADDGTAGAGTDEAVTTHTYSDLGRLVMTTVDPTTASNDEIETSFCYDADGNQLWRFDDDGATQTCDPDSGSFSDMAWGTGYDLSGRVVCETDPADTIVDTATDMVDCSPAVTHTVTMTATDGTWDLRYGSGENDVLTGLADDVEPNSGGGNLQSQLQAVISGTTVTGAAGSSYVIDWGDSVHRLVAVGVDNLTGGTATVAPDRSFVAVYEHDPLGRTSRVIASPGEATQRVTETDYDEVGRLTKTRAETGVVGDGASDERPYRFDVVEERTYLPDGRLEKIITPPVDVFSFDWATGSGKVTTLHSYDDAGRLESVTAAYGTADAATTTYVYDSAGRVATETTPAGRATSYTYDDLGRVMEVRRHGDLSTFVQIEGATGGTWDIQVDSETAHTGLSATYALDDLEDDLDGDVTGTLAVGEAGNVYEITWGDGADHTVSLTDNLEPGAATITEIDGVRQARTYTPNGLLATETDFALDPSAAGTPTRSFTYFDVGWMETATDANDVTVKFGYDARGNRRALNWSAGSCTGANVTDCEIWAYNDANQVTSHTFAYDDTNTDKVDYTYDIYGRLTTLTEPLDASTDRQTTYNYTDHLLTGVDYTDDGGTTVRDVDYTYDPAGRRASMTDERITDHDAGGHTWGTATTTWEYDQAGNLISADVPNDEAPGGGEIWEWWWSLTGQRRKMQYPEGTDTLYKFDHTTLGRLDQTSVWSTSTWINLVDYTYDADGLELQEDLEGGTSRQRIWDRNVFGQPIRYIQDFPSGEDEEDLEVRISNRPDGRQWNTQTGDRQTPADGDERHRYSYDDAGQVTLDEISTHNGTTWSTWANSRRYTYSDRGEITDSETWAGAYYFDTDNTYNDAGHLTQASTTVGGSTDTTDFAYNRIGERTQSDLNTGEMVVDFEYDPMGNLTAFDIDDGTNNQYYWLTYDGDGTAIQMEWDGTGTEDDVTVEFSHDPTLGPEQVVEHDPTNGPAVQQNYGMRRIRTSDAEWYSYDHQGNIVHTDELPDAPDTYGPYGEPTTYDIGAWYFGYRGELHFTYWIYLRNRIYQPADNNFISRDPLTGVPGTPTITYPYHYADNDPLNKTDPLGLRPSDDDDLNANEVLRGGGCFGGRCFSMALPCINVDPVMKWPPWEDDPNCESVWLDDDDRELIGDCGGWDIASLDFSCLIVLDDPLAGFPGATISNGLAALLLTPLGEQRLALLAGAGYGGLGLDADHTYLADVACASRDFFKADYENLANTPVLGRLVRDRFGSCEGFIRAIESRNTAFGSVHDIARDVYEDTTFSTCFAVQVDVGLGLSGSFPPRLKLREWEMEWTRVAC